MELIAGGPDAGVMPGDDRGAPERLGLQCKQVELHAGVTLNAGVGGEAARPVIHELAHHTALEAL